MAYSRTRAEELAVTLGCPWWVAQSAAGLEPGERGTWQERGGDRWQAERTAGGDLEVSRLTSWHIVTGEPAAGQAG